MTAWAFSLSSWLFGQQAKLFNLVIGHRCHRQTFGFSFMFLNKQCQTEMNYTL